jgi:hypothetical protein
MPPVHIRERAVFQTSWVWSVDVLSPGDRVCRAFMRSGFLIAVVAFAVLSSDILLAQWISGNVGAEFILGTAALIAGACLGLFAIIAAIGLAVAAVLTTGRDAAAPGSQDATGAFYGKSLSSTRSGMDAGFPTENATNHEELDRFAIQPNREAV